MRSSSWRSSVLCASLLGCAHGHHAGHSHLGDHVARSALAAMFDIAVEAAFSGGGQSDPPPAEPTEVLPDTLDSSLVAYGLSDAQPELVRCEGDTPVQVLVTVRPSGDIAHLEVAGPPGVQQCVSNAMLGVEFPRTVRGARFRYVIPPVPRPPSG